MNRLIFLDMDGVIVNLHDAVSRLHNLDVPTAFHRGELQMTDEELWGRTDCNWWANLPWMDDGRAVLALCEDAVGAENVVICSTPAAWPGSAEGKLRWIEQQMPNYARRFVLTPDKSWCADGARCSSTTPRRTSRHFIKLAVRLCSAHDRGTAFTSTTP